MIGLGTPVYGKPGAGSSGLSAEEEESWIKTLARNTGSALEQVGLFLDTPGAIARGVLAGDPLSGFNWDYDKRVSGEDLLKSYGLVDEEKHPYLSAITGFATEVATDPLALVQFPMSALTKAGKAAKAAGVIDLAQVAAQNRMGSAARQTMTGGLAESALDSLLPRGMAKTAENYAVRPLVGPRLARATTTLDEVVQAAPDPTSALDQITKYLNQSGTTYDSVKNQKLGGAFGIGPFQSWATFTPPGSEKALDALDALGQGIAWSYPARLASAAFDERVAGTIDPGDQIAALRQFKVLDEARQAGRREAARHAETVTSIPMSDRAKTLLGADSLLSEQGNDFLTRAFEGKSTASDRVLMRELPGIQNAISSWNRVRQANARGSAQLGLDFTPIVSDKFGVQYSPRSGTELDFAEYGTGFGRSMYQSRVFEGMSRNPDLATPGGTVDLREVSKLPIVRQWAKDGQASQQSVAQVGAEIANYINRKHGVRAIDQTQGEGIARVMYRINKDLPDNVPAFAGHPLNEQSRVIISQEVARANARYVYDALAESAVPMQANQIPGSGFKNLSAAVKDIADRVGLKSGTNGLDPAVQQSLVDRISARLGIRPDQVDMSQVAIPEQVYNRLSRVQDFYSSPRVQQEVSGMLDSITQLWKGFILAFPARHSRDMLSNAISVWLETGDPIATTRGFGIAKRVLDGNIDAALPQISKLPQYANLGSPSAVRSAFLQDAAASGVLTGLAQTDVLAAKRSGELSRILPGVEPVSRMRAMRELLPDGSRNPLQMAQDFGAIRGFSNKFETRNPLLNWSTKMTDANDSIGRLGGWIALLQKGVAPQEAAKRIQNVLVDYSSLTDLERGLFRKIFPWWSYNSRIGKYAVQSMMEHPGGAVAQTLGRGVNLAGQSNDDTHVPARLRQQLSFRIPDELLAAVGIEQTPGNQTFATDFELPAVDALSLFSPFSFQKTLRNLAGQTNPMLKGLAELAFNEDLFSGRRLEDADPAVNKVYRGLTGGELSPTAKVFLGNVPGVQRVAGIAGSLMDDRYLMEHKLPKTLLNSLAGVKVTDVDQKWRDEDAMASIRDRLGPFTGEMVLEYLDKEKMKEAPEDAQKMAAVLKALEQRKRAAQKQKEQQKNLIPMSSLLP